MKKLTIIVLSILALGSANAEVLKQKSEFSHKDTVALVEERIKANNSNVFAKIDFAEGAKSVKAKTNPTTKIFLGNFTPITKLMNSTVEYGHYLPMNVLVYTDNNGITWIEAKPFPAINGTDTEKKISGNAKKLYKKLLGITDK